MNTKLMLLSGAAALALAAPARADLIVNGGFETGDFTGWTTGANSFPEYIVTSPVNSGNYAAQIAGYSRNPDTLSQTVATTAGEAYTLSFARFISNGTPTTSLVVDWDGAPVYSELDTGPYNVYQDLSVNVTGTGSDTLEFITANDPAYTYLDDVSLTPTPEPAPMLAGLLVGGLGLLARRFRRR